MKTLAVALFIAATSLSTTAFAEEAATDRTVPKISITVAEGYTILFKDGVTPGSVSTRFMLGLGWRVGNGFGVSTAVGILTTNDLFRPAPRIAFGASYSLSSEVSLGISGLYQYNPSYGGKPDGHVLAGVVGPTYKIGRFSIGLDVGPGKLLKGGPWSLLFQPRVSYTF